MSDTVQLGDVVTIVRGTTYKSALLGQPGPVLLGLGSIQRHGGFRGDALKTYGGDSPNKLLVHPGQLYASLKDVTQTADLLGAVALVPADGPVGRLTQDTVRLDVKRSDMPVEYLHWMLRTPAYRAYCHANATGTTTMGLPRENFFAFTFLIPTAWAMSLVHTLDAIERKITANMELIDRSTKLARALWAGATRDGVPLSSLARFVNGRAFTKGASGTGRVIIRIAELNSGLGSSTVRNDISVAEEHVARPGDLLFAWSGSLTVARWFRPEAIINQHIFKVIPNNGLPVWLVDQAVRAKLEDFRAIAADKATTMGHIQRAHLDQPVALPPKEEIDRLDGLMQSLWDRSLAAEVETLRLQTTRDELLPLLSSGRVQVPDHADNLIRQAAQ